MLVMIITIIVAAFLTVIIFSLAWLGYSSCLKIYRIEVSSGQYDDSIVKMYTSFNKKREWVGVIISSLILVILFSLFAIGLFYKIKNENITINNKTILVIKSGSMADFYNEDTALEWDNNTSLQFSVGDICIFETVAADEQLVRGEVYGYKRRDQIITHRLININGDSYRFKGDNNPIDDGYSVPHSAVLYHYTGQKIQGLGIFILYAQSYFGVWSLICMIIIMISSEIVYHKIDKINRQRYAEIHHVSKPKIHITLNRHYRRTLRRVKADESK